MSEDRLAAELFAARKRALGDSDRVTLSAMAPRIQRQYVRFADELRPRLDQNRDRAAVDLDDIETRVTVVFVDADVEGVDLNAMTVAELTALVMAGIRTLGT